MFLERLAIVSCNKYLIFDLEWTRRYCTKR